MGEKDLKVSVLYSMEDACLKSVILSPAPLLATSLTLCPLYGVTGC